MIYRNVHIGVGMVIKNFNVGQTVFSFLKMSNDEWLFVSAAEILDVHCNSRANVKILEKYKSFFGRPVMKYIKGNTFARYVFRMNGIIENCIVKKILLANIMEKSLRVMIELIYLMGNWLMFLVVKLYLHIMKH